MTIVTFVHRPKPRPRAKARPAAVTSPAIVSAVVKRERRQPSKLQEDSEADARVAALFARNIRPPEAG
jgi:hypothetical protein